jgi:hypothetical protein
VGPAQKCHGRAHHSGVISPGRSALARTPQQRPPSLIAAAVILLLEPTCMVSVHLSPARVTVALLCAIAVLVGIHALSLFGLFELGRDHQLGLFRLFNLSEEGNVPTWFSTTTLLLCACLLGITWRVVRAAGERFARHWAGLALVFLFIAIDEGASIHELFILPLRSLLATEGALYFAWVIPYGIAAAGFGLAYLRFLLALPRRTAALILAAGLLFVGGALGMEMLAPFVYDWSGEVTLPMFVMLLVEETLEMLGVAIFVHALLDHLARRGVRAELRFAEGATREADAV